MAARAAAVQAADKAYTAAVQAAVAGQGTWLAVQLAKHAVHQAVSAAHEESTNV